MPIMAGSPMTASTGHGGFPEQRGYLRMLGMGIDDGFDVDGIGPALAQAQDLSGAAGRARAAARCWARRPA
jgi:hypothetical protein